MEEKALVRILFSITMMLASWPVDAHQPVLNSESRTAKSPYIVEEPEISKAIFSELIGKPHYYRIDSNSRFKFYAGITVPKIDNCPISKKFSFEVLDEDFGLIERKYGENFNWRAWYEKHGEKWYWIGPEIGEEFKSNRFYKEGTYYLSVYNKTNTGQYVLALGDIESFPIFVIFRMLLTMPNINSTFWDDVKYPETSNNG